MATVLTFSIPDGIAVRVRDAFCARHGYKDFIDDGDGGIIANPETKLQFVKRHIKEYIQQSVIAYEAQLDAAAAKQAAEAEIVDLTITAS